MRNLFLVPISIVCCAGILQGQTDETSNEGVSVGTIPEGNPVIVTFDPAMLKQLEESPSNQAPAPMNYELYKRSLSHLPASNRDAENMVAKIVQDDRKRGEETFLKVAGVVLIGVIFIFVVFAIDKSKKSPTPASEESLPEDPPSY